MRRVIAFLKWKAVWWIEEGHRHLDVRPDIADSICTYVVKQASINRALACSFKTRWESALETEPKEDEQDGNDYTGEVDRYGEAEFDTDVD